MENKGRQFRLGIFSLALLSFSFTTIKTKAQISIVEIKAIYVSKTDGRVIPEKEFQSYKGAHTFHKLIKGKDGRDTIVITPPNKSHELLSKKRKKDFEAQVGKQLKPFNTIDLFGNKIDSKAFKGKVIVINFWFVACGPCIQEMPMLNELVDEYSDRNDIVFLGMSNDTPEVLGKFLTHSNFNYEIIPNSRKLAQKYLVQAYPTHIVIDKLGLVKFAFSGLTDNSLDELKRAIEKVL